VEGGTGGFGERGGGRDLLRRTGLGVGVGGVGWGRGEKRLMGMTGISGTCHLVARRHPEIELELLKGGD
jgi:hypothetical protein